MNFQDKEITELFSINKRKNATILLQRFEAEKIVYVINGMILKTDKKTLNIANIFIKNDLTKAWHYLVDEFTPENTEILLTYDEASFIYNLLSKIEYIMKTAIKRNSKLLNLITICDALHFLNFAMLKAGYNPPDCL